MADSTFADALKSQRQISITVTGRSSGRAITISVWFVHDDAALLLLPVYGSRTQLYRNLEKNPAITIQAGTERRGLQAQVLLALRCVIERFRGKYTPEEIKRRYSGLDVAVRVPF